MLKNSSQIMNQQMVRAQTIAVNIHISKAMHRNYVYNFSVCSPHASTVCSNLQILRTIISLPIRTLSHFIFPSIRHLFLSLRSAPSNFPFNICCVFTRLVTKLTNLSISLTPLYGTNFNNRSLPLSFQKSKSGSVSL